MKALMKWFLFATFCALMTITARAQQDELSKADIAFCQATREKGLDGWMSFFADNAYKGEPVVQGRDALRQFYANLFTARDLDFSWQPTHSEIFPSGELGYTSGRYTYAFTNAKGERVRSTGSYLTVWRKQADGSWKVLTDLGSADKRPAPVNPAQDKKQ